VRHPPSSALITVVREGASIIGLFVMMFYYSWQLSLILIVLAPIVSMRSAWSQAFS
jgi:subfamily B ATP-binding cassette protein MsbA